MTAARKVIVVGGGILGTSIAAAWLARGSQVVLLERYSRPNGGSVRNFGMVWSQIVPREEWVPAALRSRSIYESIATRANIGWHPCGGLMVASLESEEAVLEEFSAKAPDLGIICERWTPDQALHRHPLLKRSAVRSALWFPDNAVVEPRRAVQAWLRLLSEHQRLELHTGVTVVGVESRGSRQELRSADGRRWLADEVVIATGEDFQTLFPGEFAASGVGRCKLHMFRVGCGPANSAPAVAFGASLHHYKLFFDCKSAAQLPTPSEDLHRFGIHLLAKTAEDGSLILGDSHELTGPGDPPDFDYATVIEDILLGMARQCLNISAAAVSQRWLGYYARHATKPVVEIQLAENVRAVTALTCGMSAGPGLAIEMVERWNSGRPK